MHNVWFSIQLKQYCQKVLTHQDAAKLLRLATDEVWSQIYCTRLW